MASLFCKKCGFRPESNDKFCPSCGAPLNQDDAVDNSTQADNNTTEAFPFYSQASETTPTEPEASAEMEIPEIEPEAEDTVQVENISFEEPADEAVSPQTTPSQDETVSSQTAKVSNAYDAGANANANANTYAYNYNQAGGSYQNNQNAQNNQSNQFYNNIPPQNNARATSGGSSAGRVIASIFISIFMIILGLYASIGGIVRASVTEKNIEKFATSLDVSKIKLPSGDSYKADKFSDYVVEKIEENSDVNIDNDVINDILGKDYVNDYVQENLQSIINGIVTDSENGEISIQDTRELLDKVREDLKDTVEISDSDFELIEKEFVSGVQEFNDNFDDIKDAYSISFSAIRIVFSYAAIIAAAGIFALLFILMICINHSGVASGVIGIVLGLINCAIGFFTLFGAAILTKIFDIGTNAYKSILHNATAVSLNIGGGLILISIITLIISGVCKKRRNAR